MASFQHGLEKLISRLSETQDDLKNLFKDIAHDKEYVNITSLDRNDNNESNDRKIPLLINSYIKSILEEASKGIDVVYWNFYIRQGQCYFLDEGGWVYHHPIRYEKIQYFISGFRSFNLSLTHCFRLSERWRPPLFAHQHDFLNGRQPLGFGWTDPNIQVSIKNGDVGKLDLQSIKKAKILLVDGRSSVDNP